MAAVRVVRNGDGTLSWAEFKEGPRLHTTLRRARTAAAWLQPVARTTGMKNEEIRSKWCALQTGASASLEDFCGPGRC